MWSRTKPSATFQFTRPRGARHRQAREGDRRDVSIHAPTGGRDPSSRATPPSSTFQFTRPRGARPETAKKIRTNMSFNSRAHGGRDPAKSRSACMSTFQFTRPRGGATPQSVQEYDELTVSIHAPTGGATLSIGIVLLRRVSIHAPTGGATGLLPRLQVQASVSIHAPTGGATTC